MRKISFLGLLLCAMVLTGCIRGVAQNTNIARLNANSQRTNVTNQAPTTDGATSGIPDLAFLFQYVGPFVNGVGENGVRIGTSTNGTTVNSTSTDAIAWQVGKSVTVSYGDPVFSLLSNGSWAMTAWSGKDDPRGANNLLYHESACPVVDDESVIVISPSVADGCQRPNALSIGKSSQVFSADGGNYVMHSAGGSIYLAHLSDATQSATELESMCVLGQPVSALSDLAYGESTPVIDGRAAGYLLSDTAIARRRDGTWVLFVKGISEPNNCTSAGSLCELCSRKIYRSTSSDLVHWSALEQVVEEASVPEAVTTVDGEVRLYWQDFSNACAEQNQMLAAIAPISTASEQSDFTLSEPVAMSFPDEAFQTNPKLHYATNANPVAIADAVDRASLAACVGGE